MPSTTTFPVDFAVTPRFEVFYALYTLTAPTPSRVDKWKERALLRLPGDFEKAAKKVAPVPLFWPLLADSLQDAAGELTFRQMINHLHSITPGELRLNLLSGIFHDSRTVDALVSRKKPLLKVLSDVRLPGAELLTHFGLRPTDTNADALRAVETVLSEPESYRDRLVEVLERFWDADFRRDWAALEPGLRADASRLRERYEETSLEDFATDQKLPFSIDAKARSIKTKGGAIFQFQKIDRCYLLPSAFNTHRWWAKYENENRVRIYLPVAGGSTSANSIAREYSPGGEGVTHASVAIQPEAVFRALGDTTRYAIATVLGRTPTTSADLARTLKVSKPTITHHVQALRAAGLISEVTEAGTSRLSLNAETVRGLSAAAIEHLFASRGDLALETTRKRRV